MVYININHTTLPPLNVVHREWNNQKLLYFMQSQTEIGQNRMEALSGRPKDFLSDTF